MRWALPLLLTSMLITVSADAQWEEIGNELYVGGGVVQNTYVLVSTQGNVISSRDGESWQRKAHFPMDVRAVTIDSESNLYVSLRDGSVARSSDIGVSWFRLRAASDDPISCFALDQTTLFGCTDKGRIQMRVDTGWVTVSAVNLNLFRITANQHGRLFAAGTNAEGMLSTDHGKTWSKFALPDTTRVSAVYIQDDAYMLVSHESGLTYRTSDLGQHWTSSKLALNVIQQLGKDLIAVGGGASTYISSDGGNTWDVRFDSALKYNLSAFFVLVVDNSPIGIRAGFPSAIERTSDGGEHWSKISYGRLGEVGRNRHWYQMLFRDSSDFLVFGSDNNIVHTSDHGVTWNSTYVPTAIPGIIMSAFFISPDTGFAFWQGEGGWTTDGGKEWRPRSVGKSNANYVDAALSTPTGLLVGDSGIWRSRDRGFTWIRETTISGATLVRMILPSSDTVFIISLGGTYPAFAVTLLRSTDSGHTFTPIPSSAFPSQLPKGMLPVCTGISYRDARHVFVSGRKGFAMRTSDAGEHWQDVSIPTTHTLNAIYFVNDTLGFAGGDSVVLYSTTNGGLSWKSETSPQSGFVYRIYQEGGSIYATATNHIFRREFRATPNLVLDVNQSQSWRPFGNPYVFVYSNPNPVANWVHISIYGLFSVANETQSLTIIDLLGRKVLDLTSTFKRASNGSQAAFNADLSALGRGTFFLVFSSTTAGAIQKIVKE